MTALELARFTVDPEEAAEMLAARPAMVAELRENFPAFRRVYLTRLDERTWLDVVEWETREAAEAAMAEAMELPACRQVFGFIKEVVAMEHADVVEQAQA
jgi:hypothetical protein